MGTLNAVYVRSDTRLSVGDMLALTNAEAAEVESGMKFIHLQHAVVRDSERELATLSGKARTDVLQLIFQSTVDAFQFHHWHKGQHVRTIIYGCSEERIWERVAGAPEAWEQHAFFRAETLYRRLQGATDAERAELERIWQHAELEPGRFEPSLDARETARRVAEFYGLPGWSIQQDFSAIVVPKRQD